MLSRPKRSLLVVTVAALAVAATTLWMGRASSNAETSSTTAIMVYAVVPNRDEVLRSGMFAKGHVTIGRREALVLPIGALREDAEGASVYAVVEGALQRLQVQIGLRDEARGIVEIRSGLEPGTVVVRANLGTLPEGARVQVTGGTK